MLRKALVVSAQHGNVHVVVPRNEPAMPRRPQQAAVGKEVPYAVRAAHAVYLVRDLQLDGLHVVYRQSFHASSVHKPFCAGLSAKAASARSCDSV